MKLHWYDRALNFLIALFLLCACALFIGVLFTPVRIDVINRLSNLPGDFTGRTLLIGGAVILLILCSYLLSVAFSHKRKPISKSALVKATELGSIQITLNAVDTLVQKFTRGFSQIKDCSSRIVVISSGELAIQVKLQLMPETNVPELSAQLQSEMKEYIQNYSGVTVHEIQVVVESMGATSTAAVKAV